MPREPKSLTTKDTKDTKENQQQIEPPSTPRKTNSIINRQGVKKTQRRSDGHHLPTGVLYPAAL
jgi:hypothetical protein